MIPKKRLYLINPSNAMVSMSEASCWRKYRIWKPLGLMVVAALTPEEWEVTIIDENLGVQDHEKMPKPDLVGITAFTSQAPRAYAIAAVFRKMGVHTVMGGIHASMCPEEASQYVDAVLKGEAESIWKSVLADAKRGELQRFYEGSLCDLDTAPIARHDLLASGYAFGSIQTTRGCPLNCHFCSVSAFNGHTYRHRPIEMVLEEFRQIPERYVLVVDDNLIGTRAEHVARAKDLFRGMIAAGVNKRWICQTTINFADDEELLELAARAGCVGVFIDFESISEQGLVEIGKRFNIAKGANIPASIARIHRHRIVVVGSFIMGLDGDTPGVGRRIADAASRYGVDVLNPVFLTPLPGTRLWEKLERQGRILANEFPEDWRYYTLNYPVAQCESLSWNQIVREMDQCWRRFYSRWRTAWRIARSGYQRRQPLTILVANLSYRRNFLADQDRFRDLRIARGVAWDEKKAVAVSGSDLPACKKTEVARTGAESETSGKAGGLGR